MGVNLTIDGIKVEAREGINLIEAAKTVGIDIPFFCYHPGLKVVGQCRICLVEVEGIPKLQPACATPVKDGMVVFTDNERVEKTRAQVMEFILINHPLDCPVCDQAGECDLQDFTEAHSFPKSRYLEAKRTTAVLERRALGPHVFQNQNRCIHCSRCIRVTREIAETGELTFAERGYRMVVETMDGRPLENPWSACVADVCPVGALTVHDHRFSERSWNLTSRPSICPHCGVGCSIVLDHRTGVVKRMLPRENPEINHFWLCDFGRFSFEWMNGSEIFEPRVKGEESTWDEALHLLSSTLKERGSMEALVTPFQSCEEIGLLLSLAEMVGIVETRGEEHRIRNAKKEWLSSTGTGPNARGARELNLAAVTGPEGKAPILFVAENPHPGLCTEEFVSSIGGDTFVVADTRMEGPLAARADILLPGALFPEKEGTYVNDAGVVQHVERSFEPAPGVLPMTEYLVRLIGEEGKELPGETPEALFSSLKPFEGLTYGDLPVNLEERRG